MKRRIYQTCTALLLLAGIGALPAQSPRAYEQAANTAFESKDYYAALKYYEKVLEIEPQRSDVALRYADATRLYGAYHAAEQRYAKAMDNNAPAQYARSLLGMAYVKKSLGKYDEALTLFEQYAARPEADPGLRETATQEIDECEWAMEKITNPDINTLLERLPEGLNSGESEMGVVQYKDTLFFSGMRLAEWSDRHVPPRPLMRVLRAAPNGGKAQAAWFNAPNRHTAHPTFSADGKALIVAYGDYINDTEVNCELYLRLKTADGAWSKPQRLPSDINVPNYTATQPFIAQRADGYYDLYYASNAPGGQGGLDLWRATFSGTGAFGKAENLRALNTAYNEVTPFFDIKSNSLYFSSQGYQNIGGYDIYKTTLKGGVWAQPKHLPTPVNSSFNDLGYAPEGEDRAFLSSNRLGAAQQDGEESCCYDLYAVRYLPLNLQTLAFSKEDRKETLNEVFFTLAEQAVVGQPQSNFSGDDYKADFSVKREKQYTVIASKEGYYPDTLQISVTAEPNTRSIVEKLYLQPKPVDLVVRVFNQFSKEPLYGAQVRLYEQLRSDLADERLTGDKSNESGLKAMPRRAYLIVAEKPGFAPDTTLVAASELAKPGAKVTKNLFLTPATMYGLLPLAIYFDNDVPPRMPTARIESYDLTYAEYMARRDEFVGRITERMSEAEKSAAVERLDKFFQEDVKGGFTKLSYFAENLDLFLDSHYQVEIMIKGFASPLATKEYNMALTRRRIVSVLNYLRKFREGIYESAIQLGKLKVSTAPLGEVEALPSVSDDWRDKRASVFSVEASKERRAEIIEVKLTLK